MAVTVLIPTPLRRFTGEAGEVELDGARTVADLLRELVERYPDLGRHLLDDQGALRSFVNLYVDDEDIRHARGPETPIDAGSVVAIVPAIAGGAPTEATLDVSLDNDEIQRYARHLIMPEVGVEGQRLLKAARVLCVGTGGLGAPLSLYLAAAGVGRLGLVDFDRVDSSNLQRQVLFGTSDVGRPKVEVAAARLHDINPHIDVVPHDVALSSSNALDLISQYDLVVDGTDNFPTRYLVNDACVLTGKPNVYGSIFRFEGQLSVFFAQRGPCYRCLYPEPPPPGLVPSCAEGGVLGVLPGIIGSLQALEAIKLIIGRGDSMIGRLLLFDALRLRFRELKLKRDPDCPICGPKATIRELIDYDEFCGLPRAQAAEPATEGLDIAPGEVHRLIEMGTPFRLIDVRTPMEWEICRIEGAELIPLDGLPRRVGDLSADELTVVYCRSGARSRRAVEFLRHQGFEKTFNMRGGVLAWSDEVDPTMPKY